MIRGTVRFNGLALGEGSFTFLNGTGLRAKVAFINAETGKTHGWTESTGGWSKETLKKLEELRALIEQDFARLHLTVQEADSAASEGSSGLGEFLGSELDAPQV